MVEKCNPKHPDKIADRIAGAIVDLAYAIQKNPKVAVEVLIGHGDCHIIAESSVNFDYKGIKEIVDHIAGTGLKIDLVVVPQDRLLAENQSEEIRCGDNGIFKGVPLTKEQKEISEIARQIYALTHADGKYILDGKNLTICQSNIDSDLAINAYCAMFDKKQIVLNPLGDWTGGINVDTGATNRKLGSDMADSVTGGGLHGKDLSKADVSINIYAFQKAQITGKPVEISCAIGDSMVYIEDDGGCVETIPYSDIVENARNYIKSVGGFEKFAEWGLF